jgi:hypothetical protein
VLTKDPMGCLRPFFIAGVVVGVAMVAFGVWYVIPRDHWFGLAWTVIALAIAASNVYNAFFLRLGPRKPKG